MFKKRSSLQLQVLSDQTRQFETALYKYINFLLNSECDLYRLFFFIYLLLPINLKLKIILVLLKFYNFLLFSYFDIKNNHSLRRNRKKCQNYSRILKI